MEQYKKQKSINGSKFFTNAVKISAAGIFFSIVFVIFLSFNFSALVVAQSRPSYTCNTTSHSCEYFKTGDIYAGQYTDLGKCSSACPSLHPDQSPQSQPTHYTCKTDDQSCIPTSDIMAGYDYEGTYIGDPSCEGKCVEETYNPEDLTCNTKDYTCVELKEVGGKPIAGRFNPGWWGNCNSYCEELKRTKDQEEAQKKDEQQQKPQPPQKILCLKGVCIPSTNGTYSTEEECTPKCPLPAPSKSYYCDYSDYQCKETTSSGGITKEQCDPKCKQPDQPESTGKPVPEPASAQRYSCTADGACVEDSNFSAPYTDPDCSYYCQPDSDDTDTPQPTSSYTCNTTSHSCEPYRQGDNYIGKYANTELGKCLGICPTLHPTQPQQTTPTQPTHYTCKTDDQSCIPTSDIMAGYDYQGTYIGDPSCNGECKDQQMDPNGWTCNPDGYKCQRLSFTGHPIYGEFESTDTGLNFCVQACNKLKEKTQQQKPQPPQKILCLKGICIPSTNGTYSTEEECTPKCPLPAPSKSYYCDYSDYQCKETTSSGGITEKQCRDDCIQPDQLKYSCDTSTGKCVKAVDGFWTNDPTCNNQCLPPEPTSAPISTTISIEVSPSSAILNIGKAQQLTILCMISQGLSSGNCSSLGAKISFISSNASVAIVDSNGLVKAIAAGSANITITATKETASASTEAVIWVNDSTTPTPTPTPSPSDATFTCDTRNFTCIPYTETTYTFGKYGDTYTCSELCVARYYCELATKQCRAMPYEWYSEGFTNDFNEKECSDFCSTSGTGYFCNETTKKCEQYPGRSGGDYYSACKYKCDGGQL